MKNLSMILVFTALTIIFAPVGRSYAATPTFTTLQPGQFREINQNLQINIVFVGYEPGTGPRDINEIAFRTGLPNRYRTLDINPSLYVTSSAEDDQFWVGNSFNYNYNIIYADQAFEDSYFSYVPTISRPCRITFIQQLYNTQQARSLNITGDSLTGNTCIEATRAEKWLAENAPSMLGVDTTKYTIFYINWYGRTDFRFHTYLPFALSDPDPDTGFNWGLTQGGQTIAWGGTTPDDAQNGLGSLRRVWLHDLSAGPDYLTQNYKIDAAEFGGLPYYTLPPVWEYGNISAYRPFDNLSGDLAKVTRYVALDSLFTTSPVYSPALSPPKMPDSIELEISLFNVDTAINGRSLLKPDRIVAEETALRPYNSFSISIADQSFSGSLVTAYLCTRQDFLSGSQSCYGQRPMGGFPGIDLFFYFRDHHLRYVDGDADYEIPVFTFLSSDSLGIPGFVGYADDDHSQGIQSFCYLSSTPRGRSFWAGGNTWVSIHEVGHHLGASHPHNAFDYEDFDLFGPWNPEYNFMWVGGESDTIMGYSRLSHNFSQFDRDNMNRWMTAEYLNETNTILPIILARPRVSEVSGLLDSADSDAAAALTFYQSMNYSAAVLKAKSTYDKVIAAADRINIRIEPNGGPSDLRNHRPNPGLIDPPYGQYNALGLDTANQNAMQSAW